MKDPLAPLMRPIMFYENPGEPIEASPAPMPSREEIGRHIYGELNESFFEVVVKPMFESGVLSEDLQEVLVAYQAILDRHVTGRFDEQ